MHSQPPQTPSAIYELLCNLWHSPRKRHIHVTSSSPKRLCYLLSKSYSDQQSRLTITLHTLTRHTCSTRATPSTPTFTFGAHTRQFFVLPISIRTNAAGTVPWCLQADTADCSAPSELLAIEAFKIDDCRHNRLPSSSLPTELLLRSKPRAKTQHQWTIAEASSISRQRMRHYHTMLRPTDACMKSSRVSSRPMRFIR